MANYKPEWSVKTSSVGRFEVTGECLDTTQPRVWMWYNADLDKYTVAAEGQAVKLDALFDTPEAARLAWEITKPDRLGRADNNTRKILADGLRRQFDAVYNKHNAAHKDVFNG